MTHQKLEDLFRDSRNGYKNHNNWGRPAFKFLPALDELRLTSTGRRRLGECRREFGEDTPAEPLGITAGVVGPPIANTAAQKMTDRQWLNAMTKHGSNEANWGTFTGGARELSCVLKDQAAIDPARFAQLTL